MLLSSVPAHHSLTSNTKSPMPSSELPESFPRAPLVDDGGRLPIPPSAPLPPTPFEECLARLEPEVQARLSRSQLWRGPWRRILTGAGDAASEDLQLRFLSRPSLTPLTGAQRAELLSDIADAQESWSKECALWTNACFAYIPKGTTPQIPASPCSGLRLNPSTHQFFDLSERNASMYWPLRENLIAHHYGPISRPKIAELFSNPEIWSTARVVSGYSSSYCTRWGTIATPLRAYGWRQMDLAEMARDVRARTQRGTLRLLDLGGGMGRALQDAKEVAPDLYTVNLTSTEEPALFAFDRLEIALAEAMPEELRESVDIMISFYAMTHTRIPSLVIANALQALALGGEACLDISTHKAMISQERLQRDYEAVYENLSQLAERHLLSFDMKRPHNTHGVACMPGSLLRIVKHGAIQPADVAVMASSFAG